MYDWTPATGDGATKIRSSARSAVRPVSALPRLLQLADSAFPTGAFAHSLGLEGVHAAHGLRDERDLTRVLHEQLGALATSDLVAVRVAHGAAAEPDPAVALAALVAVDHELDATRCTRETRDAARSTGERFLRAARALLDDPRLAALDDAVAAGRTPGTSAVGWGLACAVAGIDATSALGGHAFATLSAFAAAGQRLIPLGGVAAQRALWSAVDTIDDAIARSATTAPDDLWAFLPALDVRSAQHERQRVRLFIS